MLKSTKNLLSFCEFRKYLSFKHQQKLLIEGYLAKKIIMVECQHNNSENLTFKTLRQALMAKLTMIDYNKIIVSSWRVQVLKKNLLV